MGDGNYDDDEFDEPHFSPEEVMTRGMHMRFEEGGRLLGQAITEKLKGTGVGTKFDDGKLRYDLLDHIFERAMAQVVTDGAKAHGDNNWQKLDKATDRYYAALRRHLDAWLDGEVIDPKHGTPHMAHVAVNAMFLNWFDRAATYVRESHTPATGPTSPKP